MLNTYYCNATWLDKNCKIQNLEESRYARKLGEYNGSDIHIDADTLVTISLVCDTEFLHFIQLEQINKVKDGKKAIIHMDIISSISL